MPCRGDPHEDTHELHHVQPHPTPSTISNHAAISNTLRHVCMAHGLEHEALEMHEASPRNLFWPLLGVEVPRKLRTGVAR